MLYLICYWYTFYLFLEFSILSYRSMYFISLNHSTQTHHTFLSSLYIWWLAKCSMWQWSLVNQTYPNIVMCDNAPPHLGGHLFSITLIAHHITMIACVEVEILKCFGSRQKVQHVLSISSCCNERSCLWYFFYYAMVLIWISTFFQLIYCNKVAHDLAVLCSMHCRCIQYFVDCDLQHLVNGMCFYMPS